MYKILQTPTTLIIKKRKEISEKKRKEKQLKLVDLWLFYGL